MVHIIAMLLSLRSLARWTKLLLACFALLTAASSQAAVSSASSTEVVVVA